MRVAVALSVVALSAEILLTAACSGPPSAPGQPAAATPGKTAGPTRAPAAATASAAGFTVTGSRPVPRGGSQDTSAQAAGASCDPGQFAADRRLGATIASGFAVGGLPASADLLR